MKYFSFARALANLAILISVLFPIFTFADGQPRKEYAWEGYWGAKTESCWENKNDALPYGFFSDRLENWEADCEINSIESATNKTKYDTLNLACKSMKHGNYTQAMRLNLTPEGKTTAHLARRFWLYS